MTGRRSFLKSCSLVLAVVTTSLWQAGCNVFNDILNYVGVGIQAITSVVNLLAGAGVVSLPEGVLITTILSAIKVGFADVSAAVTEYENAPAADKATLEGKISTALQAVADQIQKFWSDLNIPDAKLSSIVEGLIGIILSTIAGFVAQLPAPAVAARATPLKKTITITPTKRTSKKFVSDFNAALNQAGYSQYALK